MTNGTTNKAEKKARLEDALNELYGGDRVRDLTDEGYRRAITKLRRSNPTRARQVERILAPFFGRRVFPRRSIPWQSSSMGTRARLALLPQNPHLQADLQIVRTVIGVPDGQIQATDAHPLWRRLEGVVQPKAIRRAVEGLLAGPWLHVHRQEAQRGVVDGPGAQRSIPDAPEFDLPAELRDTAVASAWVDLSGNEMPEWLRRSPDMVESPGLLEAPIDWASAALLERHHLPKRLAGPMTACVLTMNLDWIASLEPLEVEVTHPGGSYTLSRNFTVAVRGLDEYVTKADWVRVWEAYVKP